MFLIDFHVLIPNLCLVLLYRQEKKIFYNYVSYLYEFERYAVLCMSKTINDRKNGFDF